MLDSKKWRSLLLKERKRKFRSEAITCLTHLVKVKLHRKARFNTHFKSQYVFLPTTSKLRQFQHYNHSLSPWFKRSGVFYSPLHLNAVSFKNNDTASDLKVKTGVSASWTHRLFMGLTRTATRTDAIAHPAPVRPLRSGSPRCERRRSETANWLAG